MLYHFDKKPLILRGFFYALSLEKDANVLLVKDLSHMINIRNSFWHMLVKQIII